MWWGGWVKRRESAQPPGSCRARPLVSFQTGTEPRESHALAQDHTAQHSRASRVLFLLSPENLQGQARWGGTAPATPGGGRGAGEGSGPLMPPGRPEQEQPAQMHVC